MELWSVDPQAITADEGELVRMVASVASPTLRTRLHVAQFQFLRKTVGAGTLFFEAHDSHE